MIYFYATEKNDTSLPVICRFKTEAERETWIRDYPRRTEINSEKMIASLDRIGDNDPELYWDDSNNRLYMF